MPHCCICNLNCSDPSIIDGSPYCQVCRVDQFVRCSGCGNFTPRDIAYRSNRNYYCESCYRNLQRCCYCGTHVASCRTVNGEQYCPHCYENCFRRCEECGRQVTYNSMRYTPSEDRGLLCRDCFSDVCYVCDECGDSIWIDDAIHTDDGTYCSRCHRHSRREWEAKEFIRDNITYDIIGSTRKFGVELETSECPDHAELFNNTIWGCKTDCSISGMEFVSPILYGDQGLEEIETLCESGQGWKIHRTCGYHVHLDVTNEDWRALRSIAYAYHKTYSLWCHFVSDYRCTNHMCAAPSYSVEDILDISNAEDWDYFVAARDRFEFVNWRAYLVHGTIEIRIHDASLNAEEICNWVKCHARFIDFVGSCSRNDIKDLFSCGFGQQFQVLSDIIGKELSKYYAERAYRHGHQINLTSAEFVV